MNIYVGNLNYRVREKDLKEILSPYGSLTSIKMIKDRETGRFKGYAFVEMAEEEGRVMITSLNGSDLMGRVMVVKEAEPRQ